MSDLVTIRIYFEYGEKMKNLSFWKRINFDLAAEIIKKAKAHNLDQVLNFNVSRGYFEKKKINWGYSEMKHSNHPHVVEITDTQEKLNAFLDKEQLLFEGVKILLVKNEVVLSPVKSQGTL
ncbi:DUF190 domain-containing protein [Zunongwangia sp. H14]|uniref:DUF190 domain-containing protein n=1 Tax=Zunongwangia sp. H14 TaxID=3240792 RepID=UPI00356AA6EF